MKIENLVSMANQIGDFFKSFPDQEQAKKDIAQHLERFWASSMRDQILAYVIEKNGEGLELIVRDAIKQHITGHHKK
jgi:formate dehydrogenase subunit delta